MPEITISGALDEVFQSLTNIKALTSFRKGNGWPLFQPDEEYFYENRKDEHVCPRCEDYGVHGTFIGSDVPREFPDNRRLGSEAEGRLHPEVHITYPEFRGHCRCRVTFQNISETLVNRLDTEFRRIVV